MIQRIQTLFLFGVAVLSGLMLTGDLVMMDSGSGTLFSISFMGLSEEGGGILQRLWPLTFLLALVPVLSLVAIFLYRRRPLQMRVTMIVLLLSLGTLILGAFYVLMFDRKIDITILWKVRAVFPLVSAILAWLAHRAILRDELLVKSYDRLR
jgi:hypothetical protein